MSTRERRHHRYMSVGLDKEAWEYLQTMSERQDRFTKTLLTEIINKTLTDMAHRDAAYMAEAQ